MQEMTRAFNDETVSRNLYRFMGEDARDYLPNGVTENDFLERLELDESLKKKNDCYLSRCYNNGEENEFTKYHRSVLEAKIYFGNNIVCSVAAEPIENSDEYLNQSDEAVKQDCESKAFVRLAVKIIKKFPRLPIIITADGTQKVGMRYH